MSKTNELLAQTTKKDDKDQSTANDNVHKKDSTFRLIVMSWTLKSSLFEEYFDWKIYLQPLKVGAKRHQVDIYFLDDLKTFLCENYPAATTTSDKKD